MDKYTKYSPLYPPRPEAAIPSQMLLFYEKKGWVAQYKKNGTYCVIWVTPKREVIIKTRHTTNHKAWSMTEYLKQEILARFPEKKWFVLCAELLHSKTSTIKDTLYIHDLLVWKSQFMLASTFMERQLLLDERFMTNVEAQTHYVCDDRGKLLYAKRFTKDFKSLFNAIKEPKIDEGLVLKNPEGKLRSCISSKENSSWQVKCRKKTKNYNF
jgi:hypothetical protein